MPIQKKIDINLVFHALGDPTRRAIMVHLSKGPVSVSNLAKPLNITLAAVVQHLQVLEESGLAKSEKVGRVRTCRMESAGLQAVEKWVSERRTAWEQRFDRLEELLADEDEN